MSTKTAMKRTGDCYDAAMKLVIEEPTLTLCHGIVAGRGPLKGFWIGHAWVEDGDVVFDFSNGNQVILRKEVYYALGKISTVVRYKGIESNKTMLKTGHCGPWDESVTLLKPVARTVVERQNT